MRRPLFALIAVLTLAAGACASGGGGAQRPSGSSRNVITEEEISSDFGNNAYDLIRRLRPNMLTYRGHQSLAHDTEEVQVYVDGIKMGGPEVLRQIQVDNLKEIRYISAAEATTRFGTGNTNGAILITTK